MSSHSVATLDECNVLNEVKITQHIPTSHDVLVIVLFDNDFELTKGEIYCYFSLFDFRKILLS